MTEHGRRRNDTAFGIVLLLLCVLPVAGYWWWKNHGIVPPICAPVIYELRPGTTLELQAVSIGQYGSDQFWSPNGVPIPQGDLKHASGGPDMRMRALYFQCVSTNASEDERHQLRIKPSPVISGVGISGITSSKQHKPVDGHYVTNHVQAFAPDVGMFHSTEVEVSYSNLGFFDVGVLESGESEKEFSVAGDRIAVSIVSHPTKIKGNLRVEVLWAKGDLEFDISLINVLSDSVGPQNHGRAGGRDLRKSFAEFPATAYSQVKIRAQYWDRKIKFSGISYDPGSYTQPTVTEVTP